jgi:glycosyltransferase involved in cell wall biosynthesis
MARRRLVFSTANVVDFDYSKLLAKRRDLAIYEVGVRLAAQVVVQTEEQVSLCERTFGRRPALIKSIAIPAEPQDTPPEAFLWVGRLVDYKRPLEYIALARALPEARFWMVGVPTPHGEDGRRLVEAVHAAAGELSNLKLLPPRSRAGVEALMGRAVASVNTADYEGMPNVLLEAWTRGVPALVLTHDPGGVVAAHGLGRYAHGSRGAFVEQARELWAGRHDRGELAARCRRYVVECHGAETVGQQWLAALELECAG